MTDAHTPADAGGCPYPVREFNSATTGPVLSHAEEIDALRREHPFLRSTYANGFWVLTGAEVIRDALHQPELFSSTCHGADSDPPYKWIPELLDPPEHTGWRQLLASHFAPAAMDRMEDMVRERCIELIEQFAAEGQCDFLGEFASRLPTSIFMELMGLPIEGRSSSWTGSTRSSIFRPSRTRADPERYSRRPSTP